ncbi:DUF6445 family protein [Stakelama marina]|uniref:Uncharacterized protein n=1 Tax=Stakelama marina TaxID=2826939 RepID=A0A8T4IET6_9SPHN|nr:DUF6445 family protein [Stakelama marina]MBR0552572.1 hypothetical protein [Stakelama marina]
MPTSLLVVDDFLQRPDAVRAAALRLSYPDLQGAFAGRNSEQRMEITGLSEEVSRLTGEALTPIQPLRSHSKCRITLEGEVGLGRVHIDPGYWSGILYLSRPEDCQGGTEFFRHKPTNSDRAPITHEELRAAGFSSTAQLETEVLNKHSNDESKWEKTMEVPMRYNRLLLLRPWMWHTAGPGFGNCLENGRLIMVMFFQPKR